MGARVIKVGSGAGDRLRQGIAAIQAEQHVTPVFPDQVEQAAREAAHRVQLPEADHTDLPFVTIDPDGSMDLDQAMHLARDGQGYVVHYAIACLPAFIEPGGVIDAEAHKRGETLYGADATIPLHPTTLSEGAASLLPGQVRPAYLWTIGLDPQGATTTTHVERAKVTSVAKLTYAGVQADIDAGSADPMMQLLAEIGKLRVEQERARGGVNLPLPEQEVSIDGDQWSLTFRQMSDVETWNAQISLLTGIAAADIMLAHKVGVLRTLPPAPKGAVDRLRHVARGLHIHWPGDQDYPDFVRSLDVNTPTGAAMAVACTTLLRGAAYTCFNGDLPELREHAALATEYAHVTAPLRRLVDRFGLETCAALCAGEPVPDWVLSAYADLPATMQEADRRSHAYERAVLDLVEASVLRGSVGASFAGVVVEADGKDPHKGTIQISDPAVEAPISGQGPVPAGEEVTARLVTADPATRKVAFSLE